MAAPPTGALRSFLRFPLTSHEPEVAASRLLRRIPPLAPLPAGRDGQDRVQGSEPEWGSQREQRGGQDPAEGVGHRAAKRQPGGPLCTCWELLSAQIGGTRMSG